MGTRNLILAVLILLAINSVSLAQLPTSFLTTMDVPFPTGTTTPTDPNLQNLRWNRWETSNFVILSLDTNQGVYLVQNIEQMKSWCMKRWSFPNVQIPKRSYKEGYPVEPGCILVCVPSKDYLEKLFKLSETTTELRRDGDNKIIRNICWVVLDDRPAINIPFALTEICLQELCNQNPNMTCHPVVLEGVSLLNSTSLQIRTCFAQLSGQEIDIRQLMSVNFEDFKKYSNDQKMEYRSKSAMVCLMIRKEYGQSSFLNFATAVDGSKIKSVGFVDSNQLNTTLARYSYWLVNDITNNRTPDKYLEIEPVKR